VDSQQKIDDSLSRRQIGWMAPLMVMIGRSVFMILAQAVVALKYGARSPVSMECGCALVDGVRDSG